ncbi:MAG: HTH-type transcriptional activator mta [Candidatus Aerophobetes bacterium ADurb.Bin490]|nr:MAG: HTH-type transcriptional activator mta [Candidatus Aerophobetes bacterium ADurb.Bin490]HNZ28494.1 MerR family transcriptional regulator [Candidatus Goldiibacteriota bacterium]HPI02344.1 MerR family transcriptional regulator [Candidatus Goldiibacteriota bacterium]HPN63745.1 MerR family transcriptional regulator [Candidatus Goldiibacteriota bacterium]HRQ43003.1 MerR family transcriptional regulator [Candidatus Goldiibacteriota bacterium]
MKEYTVKKLAAIAGVSVRTLHHYDKTGILRPFKRTDAGYRVYREKELLKLQQIMFYRELEMPLNRVKVIINKAGFDMVKALENHKKCLTERNQRTKVLIRTIDKTIKSLKEKNAMLKDEELYEGFSKEEIKAIKKEVKEKYDPKMVKESYQKVAGLSKPQYDSLMKEGEDIAKEMALLLGSDPAGEKAQKVIAKHYKYLHNFYKPNPEMYKGLGDLYASDERFRAYYEKFGKNLADFMKDAIYVFAGAKKGDK